MDVFDSLRTVHMWYLNFFIFDKRKVMSINTSNAFYYYMYINYYITNAHLSAK